MAKAPSAADAPSASQLAQKIEAFLADHPAAAVLEDGRVVFEMRVSRYTISESHGRCLLQLWSEERNLMRTVIDVQERAHTLRISTRRMGAPKPQTLELVASSDRRTPTVRDSSRRNYQRMLERVLTRSFIGVRLDGFRSAMDLEHSFGPAYVRGRMLRGTGADAIIGVGAAESSSTVDGILTLGLLWLDYCRQHSQARRHFGGLKIFVPEGTWKTTGERMAWLNHATANFELYTIDERNEELTQIDFRDTGNLESRLMNAFSAEAAIERCRTGIDQLMSHVPAAGHERVELRPHSPSEVGLLLHGLEFARVRHGASTHSFARVEEVTFGAGANETPLTTETGELCRDLFSRLLLSRRPDGMHTDPLFRMQPERWLESELRAKIAEVFPPLRRDLIYSQVPALSSGERGMLDLLTLDRQNRLTIIEVKADEDLQLPLQALDYWIRVRALNAEHRSIAGETLSAFERQRYFEGTQISQQPPRLLLIAPALRIHPANEQVLRYLAPDVEWEIIALGEHWRRDLSVVFRKRSSA